MKVDIGEALRYAGVRGVPPAALRREMEALAARLERQVRPRSVWRAFPVVREDGALALVGSGVVLTGALAARRLEGCAQAALLVCTLGESFDAMLRAEQVRDMARAVLLDGCGSAWVEAACGQTEAEIAARFPALHLTGRFSPGYGDLPLELQRQVCAALDAERRVGVCVTESLLLDPMKSVAAIVGLSERPGRAAGGCGECERRENCPMRKEGTPCE